MRNTIYGHNNVQTEREYLWTKHSMMFLSNIPRFHATSVRVGSANISHLGMYMLSWIPITAFLNFIGKSVSSFNFSRGGFMLFDIGFINPKRNKTLAEKWPLSNKISSFLLKYFSPSWVEVPRGYGQTQNNDNDG